MDFLFNLPIKTAKLLMLTMILGLLFLFAIPKMPKMYHKWKNFSKPSDFSNFVSGCFVLISFLIITIILYVNYFINLKLDSFFVFILPIPFLIFLFIPRSLFFFQKFKATQRGLHFSLAILLSFFALLCFSSQFMYLLKSILYVE
jgi:hypothetical protein